jgi:hypothetical protein
MWTDGRYLFAPGCRAMKHYDPLKAPSAKEWESLDEQERIDLVVEHHRRARVRLPNVKVHSVIHVIVENQIALGDEVPAKRTLERLMAEGLDRHQAIHAVGSVLMDHLLDLLNDPETDPTADRNPAYGAALERLTAAEWLNSDSSQPPPDRRDDTEVRDTSDFESPDGSSVADEVDVEEQMSAPTTSRNMPVSWGVLRDAFEFASLGEPGESSAFLNRESGDFIYHSAGYLDPDEDLPEDIDDDDKYVRIPHKRELNLGKRLALAFVMDFLPNDFDKARAIFNRRGAYARFKDLLEHRNALDQWYEYESKTTEEALRAWCAENEVEIVGAPAADG